MSIKIVKLEIQDAPEGYENPYMERAEYPELDPQIFSELDAISYETTSRVIKELYPLRGYAFGKKREYFYIRDKDMKVFEEMIKVFVEHEKHNLLKTLIDYGREYPKNLWRFILELNKKFTPADEFL